MAEVQEIDAFGLLLSVAPGVFEGDSWWVVSQENLLELHGDKVLYIINSWVEKSSQKDENNLNKA